MYKNLYFLIIILLLTNEIVGKNGNNAKSTKNSNKKSDKKNVKVYNERGKRSLNELEKSFLSHIESENQDGLGKFSNEDLSIDVKQPKFEIEPPFWGTRGRRDGSSEHIEYVNDDNKIVKCKLCNKYFRNFHKNVIKEELDPFWFERGVKDKSNKFSQFWTNEGKRDEMEPFWGNRGRRDEMDPFWGNRGRRDEMEPFWGNRGRREEAEPFWGNRGRRDEMEPFWGNRGRRDEIEPFWGTRGRRQENEPFWGTRGRRETKNILGGSLYWDKQERKKTLLKENIFDAIDDIKIGIEDLSRMRRSEGNSFWNGRGRDSKLNSLFKQQARNRIPFVTFQQKLGKKPIEQNTVLDERMYAEQPHYILIERSSRSSAEDDPFFISRGKKYTNSKVPKRFRDRRGVLEELVKSVRTDPYYIARGKKDSNYIKIGNTTILKEEFLKAKELICSAIDLLIIKNGGNKVKRDIDESERERRTILKKLAAQLQMDPYFVSRGKKNGDNDVNVDQLEDFISHVMDMCK